MVTRVGFFGKTVNTLTNKDVRISKRLYMPSNKLRGFESGKIGPIQNGDYISSSTILGYGCKQQTSTLHNYTVAKCCSVINWTTVSTYITSNNQQYKIAFVACTYHCG